MSAAARKHESDPEEPTPVLAGNPDGTEYATRGARGHKTARPHLRMVSPLRPERASRGMFALVVTGLLGVGMIVILVINTSLAQGAFTISELKGEQAVLAQQEQTLTEQVAAAAAPDTLEQQARALGMVPSVNPVFLDVTTGKVLGKPKAAAGARSSVPRLLTPADATVTEAVDNGLAGLPTSPGADYDPAAADAAALQAAAANAPATEATAENEFPATGDAGLVAQPITEAPSKPAAKAKKTKNPNAENNLWEDSTVLDQTGKLSSDDSGLLAVPVQ
jgi:hypothetical protein